MKSAPPAASLFTPAQLQALRPRSNWRGLALVAHAWGVVGGSLWLAACYPTPVVWLLAGVVIGSRQLGLLILMHDAAHGLLARTPWLNQLLGQLGCAWPTFADTGTYRAYHLRHHAHTLQAEDPDRGLTSHYPITRRSLWRKCWRDVSGQTGFAQRRAQCRAALGTPGTAYRQRAAGFWRALGPQCLTNAALALALWLMGQGSAYLWLWLLPLLTWQQLVLRLRNIAEHAVVPDAHDPFGNARTTRANWLARALVAPYWVNYHLEHHLLMWVPCYRLPLAHAFLKANGYGARSTLSAGYLRVLAEVTRAGSPEDPPDVRVRAMGTFGGGFSAE